MKLGLQMDWVDKIAAKHGWKRVAFQEDIRMASYRRPYGTEKHHRINVYLTTGTIATALHRPVSGSTQLFRKGLTTEQIEEVFRKPRIHTGLGYYRRQAARHIREAAMLEGLG